MARWGDKTLAGPAVLAVLCSMSWFAAFWEPAAWPAHAQEPAQQLGQQSLQPHVGDCAREDFENVVGEAAAALRDLNQKNKPSFQAKLRELKDKRGWSHEAFLAGAAPLVQDETIADYDRRSEQYLAQITDMGQDNASDAAPDCGLLAQLRGYMSALVEAQQAKWAYMFAKIEAEIAK